MEKLTAKDVERYRRGIAGVESFAERYRSDPGAQSRVPELARECGMEIPAGVEARVAEDSDDVKYVVFPPDPNDALTDESLGTVAGGIRAASAATLFSTVSTMGPS